MKKRKGYCFKCSGNLVLKSKQPQQGLGCFHQCPWSPKAAIFENSSRTATLRFWLESPKLLLLGSDVRLWHCNIINPPLILVI